MTRSRKVLVAAAAVIVALAAYALLRPARKTATPAYATAVATVGDIEQTVLATAKLEPKALVSVGAQVSGQIKTLAVAVGQGVKAGQLVAEIDAQPQRNEVTRAGLGIENLKAQRNAQLAANRQAQLALERQQKMLAAGLAARADFDAAQAAYDTSTAQLAALDAQIRSQQAQLDIARINLGYTRIVAPMDGVVVAVVTKQGQTVNANQAAPTIVMLAKLDVMTIKAQVSEADVVSVKPGQTVYFTTLGNPDRRYYAKVRQIEPAPESIVNENSTTASSGSSSSTAIYYNALFDIPNTDGTLYPSMTAQVYIVIAEAKQVLTIPATALGGKDADGRYTVQVLGKDRKPQPRKVRIGINTRVTCQVLDGLRAGDAVVIGDAGDVKQDGDRGPMFF
ncbi:MAG: efflux RND transporter periplasmic adaptor subunit [Steroidobacteraceae bacterium]